MVPKNEPAKIAYTVGEAAALLSLSRAMLYRLIALGQVETIAVGRCRRVTARQLDAFVRSREAEGVTAPLPPLPIGPRRNAR